MATTQITFSTPTARINERSVMAIVARFRDRATDADVTPTNVRYRLDGECGEILGWTTATPGTSVTLTLTSAQTAIENDTRSIEPKVLSVAADYGLSTQFIETYRFEVRNNGYTS